MNIDDIIKKDKDKHKEHSRDNKIKASLESGKSWTICNSTEVDQSHREESTSKKVSEILLRNQTLPETMESPPPKVDTSSPPQELGNVATVTVSHSHTKNTSNDQTVSGDHTPVATIQQTSVITSLPKRTTDRGRLKYFQRQKSIDEASIEMETASSLPGASTASAGISTQATFTYSDKNNNEKPPRTLTEYSVVNFIENTSSVPTTKPRKIPKSNSQQDPLLYDHRVYKHLANGYFSKKGKSKSLDMIGSDEEHPRTHSYPIRFPPYHPSCEDEQTARYIKDLHISSPPQTIFGQSSFPNSPCGSPIDSALRNSPGSIGPLRRLQQEGGCYMMNENQASTQQPISFTTNRPLDSHVVSPMTKSRSHEHQQRLYKFAQKKSYSLNTAPYDLYEKNIRRILSEENVPENLLISKAMNKHYPHLRRASSYDTFNRFNPNESNASRTSPSRAAATEFYNRPPVKATKIMFPEHDNVTDCNSIFTQPIDDEKMHAMKISRILEKSFPNAIEKMNPYIHPHTSQSFEEAEKSSAKKSEQHTLTKSKSLQSQNSTDKNYTIGPYKYDPSIDNEVAVSVSGLLTLPGSNEKKYPITVGELRRRIAPPEFLNKVDMISYVRLAKSSARELLDKHAIRPKHHSRKSKHSVISKMCEAECTELANGVKTLSEAYFPKEWLANQVIGSVMQEDEDGIRRLKLTEMQQKIDITRSVLKDLSLLLEKCRTHEEMQNYNLATHSFGMSNLNNNIDLIMSFLQTQNDVIAQKFSSSEMMVRDDHTMETESGFGSKSSSLDEPHY